MYITQLHALARRELMSLAHARYMPRGYDRKASQQADRKHYELSKFLDAALATTEDRLMPSLTNAQMTALLAQAAQERTLRAMVEKMVTLLAAEPAMDQGDAHALAEIADRLHSAETVKARLAGWREELAKLVGHAERLELDFSAVHAALAELDKQVALKVDNLQDNERRLTETP